MRVTVPVAAAPRLLILVDRHPAERDFDVDGGLEERERKRDVQRFFRERRGLDDAILDVDPGQLIVQRHNRGDGGEAVERALDHEPHADAGQTLSAASHELGLRQLELRGILQLVAIAGGPERAVLTAARVDELVQTGPIRRFHALFAVGTGERVNRSSRGIELDREPSRLGIERLAVGRGRASGATVRLGEREVAERGDFAEQHERIAVVEIHGRELLAIEAERFAGAARYARDVGAIPWARIEDQAAPAGARRATEPQQTIAEVITRRGGARVDETLLVRPLRHGLARCRGADAFVRAPGVLAEQQEVPPHRGAGIGAATAARRCIIVARLDPVVPQRDDLRCAGRELRRSEFRQLRRG